MKKIYILLIALCLAFITIACNDKASDKDINNTEVSNNSVSDESTTDKTYTQKGIKGSIFTDVTLNMEKKGFPKTEPSMRDDSALYTSQLLSNNNSTLIYEVERANDFTILYACFTVMKGSEDFKKDYQYIEFASSIPYDGAEPEKAQQWVRENIDTLTENGMCVTTTIGSARFEMYGNENMKMLEIYPADK